MQKKEKNFCCLCSKWKEEPLTQITLARIEGFSGAVMVDCCNQCKIVLHNIRRIYTEKEQEWLKKRREDGKGLIEVVRR